ncbi:biotin--[acetyl-CoA-carboxylase] ligase [Deinococcus arenicola]|uniref:biotin--[biotin carboxyl-carrier protein] ligase n=1 Tax=Deinococcus arenicola TaxID=2994950 RepID=A0ABU4DPN8_9DEIO|nr:biotin--[acetyl-CoA-carboxylase] ligase [Deinococcus sp. ZS9-10]MDV6374396.1 biotin--[acetyl-CoA-carboxylase] ligase [Deinococcus sp. ZS9-10]
MPIRLLNLLTDTPQSGEVLAERLGLGRVTVNTLAHRLREDGIPVDITRAGYALTPGTPAPELVRRTGPMGAALRYLGTVGSTQDEARAWADDAAEPAPHGAAVVAEWQTGGRGRRGRAWTPTPGGLTFSVLLRGGRENGETALTLPQLSLMPLAAGVAVHAACGVGGLKWPNDLLAPDGRKLAGILLEADIRGEEARRAVLGIGLNVTGGPAGAAYLGEFRPEVTRAGVLADILTQLDRWLCAPPAEILEAWAGASVTLGRPVRVQTPRGPLEGVAQRLDAGGSLIIQTPAGPHTISAGDVELIGSLAGGPAP